MRKNSKKFQVLSLGIFHHSRSFDLKYGTDSVDLAVQGSLDGPATGGGVEHRL